MTAISIVGWALVHFLWQGTLVAAGLAVRVERRRPDRDRRAPDRYRSEALESAGAAIALE